MIGSAGLKIKDRDASKGPDTRTTKHHPAVVKGDSQEFPSSW